MRLQGGLVANERSYRIDNISDNELFIEIRFYDHGELTNEGKREFGESILKKLVGPALLTRLEDGTLTGLGACIPMWITKDRPTEEIKLTSAALVKADFHFDSGRLTVAEQTGGVVSAIWTDGRTGQQHELLLVSSPLDHPPYKWNEQPSVGDDLC